MDLWEIPTFSRKGRSTKDPEKSWTNAEEIKGEDISESGNEGKCPVPHRGQISDSLKYVYCISNEEMTEKFGKNRFTGMLLVEARR